MVWSKTVIVLSENSMEITEVGYRESIICYYLLFIFMHMKVFMV